MQIDSNGGTKTDGETKKDTINLPQSVTIKQYKERQEPEKSFFFLVQCNQRTKLDHSDRLILAFEKPSGL